MKYLMLKFVFLIAIVFAQDFEDETASMSLFVMPNTALRRSFESIIDANAGFAFGIPCSNRTEWDKRVTTFGTKIKKVISDGVRFLGTPQPAWSSIDYLKFNTTGSRREGQDMMLSRIDRLFPLALAECFYWNGSFASQFNTELSSILDQPTWVWAAHGTILLQVNGYTYKTR